MKNGSLAAKQAQGHTAHFIRTSLPLACDEQVNQTGDLANLDGLPAEEASRLTSLLKVRNAIYSSHFRQWLQDVTGCGPLSERKKDMSINDYRAGCHLLNHE